MSQTKEKEQFQQSFHARWAGLSDPHVRSLAWLLDSPDLFASDSPQWDGKIASLKFERELVEQWLRQLDSDPRELHAWLNLHPLYRLGRYAEKLMAFYFTHQGTLIAHGLQLRGANQETIGEFDFLVSMESRVLHLELATKFYLLETQGMVIDRSHAVDYFIGPNLADTLGQKMRKIIEKQLALGEHPAARIQLPRSVDLSRAVIKGWLFYRENHVPDPRGLGLSNDHCRGFWCTVSELEQRPEQEYLILPRLSWLAPAISNADQVLSKQGLLSTLAEKFRHETMPVLIAAVESRQGIAVETERGFIVPDDWQTRAGQRHGRA